jgi:hypothetical protein
MALGIPRQSAKVSATRTSTPSLQDGGSALDGTESCSPASARQRRELLMKRQIAAFVSILTVVAGVGWKLASHPETSARLQDIRLIQHSEHSNPGPTDALAGIRIRLSPSDFDDEIRAKAHQVPKIGVVAE